MKVFGSPLVDVTPTPFDFLQSHQIEYCFQYPCSTETSHIRISKTDVHFPDDLTKPKALFKHVDNFGEELLPSCLALQL